MKSLLKASFQMERFAVRMMGIGIALLTLIALISAILVAKPDVLTFEKRVLPYVDCPDDEVEEFIEVAEGKQIVRCKQNIPPGINEVLNAEYQERAEARAEAREQAAQKSAPVTLSPTAGGSPNQGSGARKSADRLSRCSTLEGHLGGTVMGWGGCEIVFSDGSRGSMWGDYVWYPRSGSIVDEAYYVKRSGQVLMGCNVELYENGGWKEQCRNL